MNWTGDGRPDTVRRRDIDDAGSGMSAVHDRASGPVRSRDRGPLPTRVTGLPELPAAYRLTVERGLVDLGIAIDAGASRAIDDHVRLLLAWNAAINLSAIREPVDIAREHVLDSLSALALLRARRFDAFIDLGSGGGFPGLPLALALPARRALLVDSVGKKARFLEAAVGAVGADARVRVAATRGESLAADRRERESWPAVLARAVAPLAELAELAFPLLARGGALVAWKRLPLADELAAARPALAALGGGPLEIVASGVAGLEDHVLVVATKIRATPAGFPRPPAERRRRPL
jgi:16S rRNA (guanine527-N7)-methyltransferase